MKWIKDFKLFESNESNVESLLGEGSFEDIKERLFEFEDMGFTTSINRQTSFIIDFEKQRPVNMSFAPYIKSEQVGKYQSGKTQNALTINVNSHYPLILNIDELKSAYEDVSYFLASAYGLKPNYIYVSRSAYIQYVYFKNFDDIKQFNTSFQPKDSHLIGVDGFSFGFYKP